ncbi:30S ribosomal protein S18 [Candidatus Daviesbacteria bacterium RIFCSPHIGHO2_01_FULL_40_24]|nr:MAG: 30S ribosomal protein S18 [Candidatus Daviesbacteria bacterium RIFCSPHIGHO2_01_FULL_40_24]OGE28853.1 MAG: 30S ribosomal protein S18 [Candidatus Daviesbacteria bacterium RIFCSPHIGHO2_02_FULL_40_16]OGE42710.1 MAG: 30S ribosomal protein S18 [Candidatus Daviesbacteria bacterium RIFCSPLOWO2_01_FULL_39_23]OGE67525.1 MAG: 30S ribosomal protein S18 [Candidatus Daviesbacteria bacterium RIFCSPLOWO2_02_FULL_39_13]
MSGETVSKTDETSSARDAGRTKKVCHFCQSKSNPSYTDMAVLRRFLTDRVKIQPAVKNGLCSKHQRVITRNIKYARHLALLPFVPKV